MSDSHDGNDVEDGATRDLVERAQSGDLDAYDRLVADEIDSLLRLAMTIVIDRELAADVVQDALIAGWRSLRQLREPSKFGSWLRRIVVNRSYNATRQRPMVRLAMVDPPGGSLEPVTDRLAIEAALRELDAAHRAVVALFYFEDRSVDDIAQLLGVPAGTVKSRLHAARARLRRALGDRDE